MYYNVLYIDRLLLTVKAVTSIFMSGRGSAVSFTKEGFCRFLSCRFTVECKMNIEIHTSKVASLCVH